MRKIPFAGIELASQRVRGLRGTSELPGRPVPRRYPGNLHHFILWRVTAVGDLGLEKLRLLVDQNWLERNLSSLLQRTLVGRRHQSESIEVALDME